MHGMQGVAEDLSEHTVPCSDECAEDSPLSLMNKVQDSLQCTLESSQDHPDTPSKRHSLKSSKTMDDMFYKYGF